MPRAIRSVPADWESRLRGVGEKLVGGGKGGEARRSFGLGLSKREGVARDLTSGGEQQDP